jgi:hypothetical protein
MPATLETTAGRAGKFLSALLYNAPNRLAVSVGTFRGETLFM